MRTENEQLATELSDARQEIGYLEQEMQDIRIKLAEAVSNESSDSSEGLRRQLREAELELEELRSNERVNSATREALRAQVNIKPST